MGLLHVLPKIACLNSMHTGIGCICSHWMWWHTAWIGGVLLRFVGVGTGSWRSKKGDLEILFKEELASLSSAVCDKNILIRFYPCSPPALSSFLALQRGAAEVYAWRERRRRWWALGRPHLTSAAPQRGHKPVRPGPSHSSHVTRSTFIPVGAVSWTELNTCQCVDGKV